MATDKKNETKQTTSKATVTNTDTKETKKLDDQNSDGKNEKAEVTADEPVRPVSAAPAADDKAAKAADKEEGDDHIDASAPASGDLIMSKEDEGE